MSMHEWAFAAVVPAHNEQHTIERCVSSILRSAGVAGVGDVWIVVAADDCTDHTVALAKEILQHRGEIVEVMEHSAGAARRAGTAAAIAHFSERSPDKLWIANTDADSYVPDDWVAVQLRMAAQGFHGLAGIIELDDASSALLACHQLNYPLREDGSHDHVHGANLAVRADAYLDAGGWSALALAEDHCLWQRLKARHWRLTSAVRSVVHTSARLKGRAAGGFADTLCSRMAATACVQS
jgi:cellulose synthase/poly-beta-1,6-N-acetylglucosamine synthase-like glycosyltransferase